MESIIKAGKMREVNLNKIGYLSQTNYKWFIESKKVEEWVSYAVECIKETTDSIAVIKNDWFTTMDIGEFSARTNSKDAIPLTMAEKNQLMDYLP